MLPSFMSKAYTVRRYPMVNDHGAMSRDFTASPELTFTLYGDAQPGAGAVDEVNRDGAQIVKTIFAQPGSGVQHDDVVEVAGEQFYVNGAPDRWTSGIVDHDVVRLSRWEG